MPVHGYTGDLPAVRYYVVAALSDGLYADVSDGLDQLVGEVVFEYVHIKCCVVLHQLHHRNLDRTVVGVYCATARWPAHQCYLIV
jgi:hypothetical protein